MSTFEWTAGQERRRAPRVNLLIELKGDLIATDESAKVLQLSLAGMTVETTIPLSPNVTHDFRLHILDGTLDVRTRLVHSRMLVQNDDVSYLSGLAFVDLPPAVTATLETLIAGLGASGEATPAPPSRTPDPPQP